MCIRDSYLLDQFTIANWNHRTDEYGGSFENRFRLPVEVVQSIKRQAGADFPVSLRYSVVSKTKAWGKGAMPYETDFEAVSYTHLDVYKRQLPVLCGQG